MNADNLTVTREIRYIGVNDHDIDLFEGLYPVPQGVSYNSYVIVDERVAVMDTVEERYGDAWLGNLRRVLDGRSPDHLIVHHMEPDHSANIARFMQAYPETEIVASTRAFTMMDAFFALDGEGRRRVVNEGDHLTLGRHTLRFLAAPMVHWPEVMVSYEETEQALFSADAFGRFGALDVPGPWAEEARRYYYAVAGKYGAQVKKLLQKVQALPVSHICPLHGPVLHAPLDQYLRLYGQWADGRAEDAGVTIACASIYGHTWQAAQQLACKLQERGCQRVTLHDLCRCDHSQAMADSFRYNKLVLASATCNADVLPPMRTFLQALMARNYSGRRVFLMENSCWAPAAARVMGEMLSSGSGLTVEGPLVQIRGALRDEAVQQLNAMADAICAAAD